MIRRTIRNKRKSNRQNKRQDCLWGLGRNRKRRPKKKVKNEIFG